MKADTLAEYYDGEELLQADGLDDAIIGIDEMSMRLVYSVSRVLDILVAGGMDLEEAREYYEFNIAGAWVGEKTPIWCEDCVAT